MRGREGQFDVSAIDGTPLDGGRVAPCSGCYPAGVGIISVDLDARIALTGDIQVLEPMRRPRRGWVAASLAADGVEPPRLWGLLFDAIVHGDRTALRGTDRGRVEVAVITPMWKGLTVRLRF
jgi:hypothetical protein